MAELPIKQQIERARAQLDSLVVSQEVLSALGTLLEHCGEDAGPMTIRFMHPVQEILVPIGKDHTARVFMYADDIEQLKHLLSEGPNGN